MIILRFDVVPEIDYGKLLSTLVNSNQTERKPDIIKYQRSLLSLELSSESKIKLKIDIDLSG